MARTFSLDDPELAGEIGDEIERLRQSGILGRSRHLPVLFDYLVERSQAGEPPREVEIAQDVFARSADAGVEDGISRVYVHRLRRRLDDHYAKAPPRRIRIDLPRGEYRLVALGLDTSDGPGPPTPPEAGPIDAAAIPSSPRPRPRTDRARPMLWAAAGAALMLAIWGGISASRPDDGSAAIRAAAASSVWSGLLADTRTTLLIEGDYYLFAQYGKDLGVDRLIHDFGIATRDDLSAYLVMHPQEAGRYGDVGLSYLPFSIAVAQQQVSGILSHTVGLRILPASSLVPGPMTMRNIVYLGLTSGLGMLAEPVGAGSRFQSGTTFDEIRDTKTGKTYFGQSGMATDDAPRRQYGLLSVFRGPQGNRYVVIAGTGDMALMGMAQTMADASALKALEPVAGGGSFEALYEIDGQRMFVNSTRLIAASPRDPQRIWSPANAPIGR